MAEALEFPEAPIVANFPKHFQEHKSFTEITDKVLQAIKALPPCQEELCTFIHSALHPGEQDGTVLSKSSTPKKLMKHVKHYCNPFNMDTLKMLITYMENDELIRQLEECERTLSRQLQGAVWDTEIDVAPPPTYKTMLVKMKTRGNTTVREAVEVRDFLAEHHIFKGQRAILCLAGLANESLVFNLAEGNIGPMLQRMQQKKITVSARGVEQVAFVNVATLDVGSGQITFHPDVTRIDPAEECKEFGVLLIGDTGTGKSTLINNLLGADVAKEGNTPSPETTEINRYRGKVGGVQVALYDTPGKDGSTASFDEALCLEIKKLFDLRKVCLTIFCFSMNEQRLKQSHIATMRAYHEATVNWDTTIVALTFADKVKAPRHERNRDEFNEAAYFKQRIDEWKTRISDTLVGEVGVPQSVVERLIMRPTIDEWESPLPDKEEWFIPLWLDILDQLAPAAYFRYLEIHRENITFESDDEDSIEIGKKMIHLEGTNLDRFKEIATDKLKSITTNSTLAGVTGAVLLTGGAGLVIAFTSSAVGVATCGIGAVGIIVGGALILGAIALTVDAHRKVKHEHD